MALYFQMRARTVEVFALARTFFILLLVCISLTLLGPFLYGKMLSVSAFAFDLPVWPVGPRVRETNVVATPDTNPELAFSSSGPFSEFELNTYFGIYV